jgi:hypothetical protein
MEVKLSEIVDVMDMQMDESSDYLNLETGEITYITIVKPPLEWGNLMLGVRRRRSTPLPWGWSKATFTEPSSTVRARVAQRAVR